MAESRVEAILQATIDGTPYEGGISSRIEELLVELKEKIDSGGGGSSSGWKLPNYSAATKTNLPTSNSFTATDDGLICMTFTTGIQGARPITVNNQLYAMISTESDNKTVVIPVHKGDAISANIDTSYISNVIFYKS